MMGAEWRPLRNGLASIGIQLIYSDWEEYNMTVLSSGVSRRGFLRHSAAFGLAAGAASASGAPPFLESAFFAAAIISATVIFFGSAISPSPNCHALPEADSPYSEVAGT